MSINLLFFIFFILILFWAVVNKVKEQEYRKLSKEELLEQEKPFFGKVDSKKRLNILIVGLATFALGMYNRSRIYYEIVEYKGVFYYSYLLILVFAIVVFFLILKESSANFKEKSIFKIVIGIFPSIIFIIIIVVILTIYTNIVAIATLNRVIIELPKKEIYQRVDVIAKDSFSNHGTHYRIRVQNRGHKFKFKVQKATFDSINVGDILKMKFYKTNNNTTYIKNYENPTTKESPQKQ